MIWLVRLVVDCPGLWCALTLQGELFPVPVLMRYDTNEDLLGIDYFSPGICFNICVLSWPRREFNICSDLRGLTIRGSKQPRRIARAPRRCPLLNPR